MGIVGEACCQAAFIERDYIMNTKTQTAQKAIEKATGIKGKAPTMGEALQAGKTPVVYAVPETVHKAIAASLASVQAEHVAGVSAFVAVQKLLIAMLSAGPSSEIHKLIIAEIETAFAQFIDKGKIRISLMNSAYYHAFGKVRTAPKGKPDNAIKAQGVEEVTRIIQSATGINDLKSKLIQKPKAEKTPDQLRAAEKAAQEEKARKAAEEEKARKAAEAAQKGEQIVTPAPSAEKPTRATVVSLAHRLIEEALDILEPGTDSALYAAFAQFEKVLNKLAA